VVQHQQPCTTEPVSLSVPLLPLDTQQPAVAPPLEQSVNDAFGDLGPDHQSAVEHMFLEDPLDTGIGSVRTRITGIKKV